MKPVSVRPITLSCMVGFINNFVQMIIMTCRCVTNKNFVTSSKIKVIVCTLTLFIGYIESLLFPAHTVVLHDGISKLYGKTLQARTMSLA